MTWWIILAALGGAALCYFLLWLYVVCNWPRP